VFPIERSRRDSWSTITPLASDLANPHRAQYGIDVASPHLRRNSFPASLQTIRLNPTEILTVNDCGIEINVLVIGDDHDLIFLDILCAHKHLGGLRRDPTTLSDGIVPQALMSSQHAAALTDDLPGGLVEVFG